MIRPQGRWPRWLLLCLAVVSGCQPRHPWYLTRNEDLATYIDAATELAHPDVERPSLPDAVMAGRPMTVAHPEFNVFWDLTLQEALDIALHNSKVIRNVGSVQGGSLALGGGSDRLLAQPNGVATIYDPASIESDPNLGVEAALAAFDAKFTNSLFWETTDRPQNRLPTSIPGIPGAFFPTVLQQNLATFNAEVSKKSATGTQFFFRNITIYNRSNAGGAFQAVPSFYTTQYEAEVRQPLLRGNGAQVNRIPLLLARIRTDVSLAQFEANVRNLCQDVENKYWELQCAYHILQTFKSARDSTLLAWDINHSRQAAGVDAGVGGVTIGEVEAQARNQYFGFRFQTEQALNDLYNIETDLRWLMGLTASDGRLLRPIDEPTTARVEFDWDAVSAEALIRSPELRQIKWFVKQRELEQIAARNNLLPDLNAVALYRWVGVGDNLINADRNGLNFPTPGSTAYDVLTEGKFEEARVGFDFAFPIGFRQAYSQVRNAQINLAREHARLEDAELNVSNLLGQAIRNMNAQYAFAQSHFNAVIAAVQETRISTDRVEGGLNIYTDNALRAIQRQADSQRQFYLALREYNKSIAFVHFRKNSLLEYDGVFLAEGPWPQKAYFDAEGHARRRAASHYLDYGWTQPPPVSVGPAPRGVIGSMDPPGFQFSHPDATAPQGEPVPVPPPTPDPASNGVDPGPAPPMPPVSQADGQQSVLSAVWNGPIADPQPVYAAMNPPPASAPLPTLPSAAAYPAAPASAAAMSYRGFSAPQPAAAPPPAPPFSSRRSVEPAAYYVPDNSFAPPTRLPPTSFDGGP